MVDSKVVGSKILELRRLKGLTQEQLGSQLNVSAQAVSKWEKGDSLPDISLLADLAASLGCTADFLLGSEGTLSFKLPQILAELAQAGRQEQIDFLGQLMDAIGKTKLESPMPGYESVEISGLPFLNIGPEGVNVWVKQKFICIASPEYLNEMRTDFQQHADFPFHVIPRYLLDALIALMPEKVGQGPEYAVEVSRLREQLPPDIDIHRMMDECIDLGFAERVRGGYRLNTKGEIALRLFSILNHTVGRPGAMSVWYKSV